MWGLQLFVIVAAGLLLGRLINDRVKAFLAVSSVELIALFCLNIYDTMLGRAMSSTDGTLSHWAALVPFLGAVLVLLAFV